MNDNIMDELIQRVMIRLEEEHLLEDDSSNDSITLCLGFSPKEQTIIESRSAKNLLFQQEMPNDFNGNEIWIRHLSVEDLMSLSLGLASSYGNLISFLLEGKKIKICQEEFFVENATSFLKSKISEAIKTLTKMGFIFEPIDFKNIQESFNLTKDEVRDKNIFVGKLITEETVMNLPESMEKLYVDPSVLITPLAQDMLKAKNIVCIKKDGLSINRKESVDEGR